MSILNRFKNIAFIAASMNIVLSPLAAGAQAQSANVIMMKEFLKSSGLNKRNLTVGDYYRNIVEDMTPSEVSKLNPYFLMYQDEPMPSVDPVVFKDKNNVEQVRLAVTIGGKTYSLQTEGSGDNTKLKMNNYTFDQNASMDPKGTINGLANELGVTAGKDKSYRSVNDLKLAPTFKEWANFTKEQKVQFLIMTRLLIEDIQKVLPVKKTAMNESATANKYALLFEMLNPDVCAGTQHNKPMTGKCIVAGWVTEYAKNGSCGGSPEGRSDLNRQQESIKSGLASTCPSKGVSCNPLFYGYQSSGGPYCVGGAETTYATDKCNQVSTLRRDTKENETEDIKRILSSYLKAKPGKGLKAAKRNADGDVVVETETQADYDIVKQHLNALDGTYREAMNICEAGDQKISMNTSKIVEGKKPLTNRKDQASACDAIVKRYIAVQQLQLAPPVPARDIAGEIVKSEKCSVPTPRGTCATGCTNDGAAVGSGGAAAVVNGPASDKNKKGGGVIAGGSEDNKCGAGVVVSPMPDGDKIIAKDAAPAEVKKEDSLCFDREIPGDETSPKHLKTACGIAGLVGIGLLAWGLSKWLTKKHNSKHKSYDPVASPVDPVVGTTTPTTTTPVVVDTPIVPIPTAETPSTSTTVTTPTDSATVRKTGAK